MPCLFPEVLLPSKKMARKDMYVHRNKNWPVWLMLGIHPATRGANTGFSCGDAPNGQCQHYNELADAMPVPCQLSPENLISLPHQINNGNPDAFSRTSTPSVWSVPARKLAQRQEVDNAVSERNSDILSGSTHKLCPTHLYSCKD
jgi:hypothetical protein